MKIGIFTFHCAVNYGAVLQTYCLQEVLKAMGHEVYVIDYRPEYLLKPYRTFLFDPHYYGSFFSKCKGFFRSCLVVPIRWRRNYVFSKFINHHLNLYNLDLNDVSNDFDVFVFGSDQIWNPRLTGGFDPIYLGDFPAARGKKLVAYAASAGCNSNLSKGNIDYFLSRIKYFDKIWVREKSLSDYLKKIYRNVETVVDPVLLAGKPVLDQLISQNEKRCFKKKFLLLFQLNRNEAIARYAMAKAKEKQLDFVELATMCESLFNRKMKQTLSIEGLLCYFKDASYVITSSFHGTAISVLYQKQFSTISIDKSVDERSSCLLKSLGLIDRMNNIECDSINRRKIDYKQFEKLYHSMRENSLDLVRLI